MPLATLVTPANFNTLVDSIFQAETPMVVSAESELGQPLEKFETAADVKAKAAECIRRGVSQYAFGLWFPSMKGQYLERRIALDPPRDGHSFRYSLSGWGIIRVQLYVTPPTTVQCRITVNSEARAASRESRYPDQGAVSDWDWRAVETYAFRLSRQLAAMGRTVPVVQ